MDNTAPSFSRNVHILKSSVNKQAIYGLLISVMAIILATLINCYMVEGNISLTGMYHVQQEQPALWILDALPFIFLFWGQHVGSLLVYEASALILDQTVELHSLTTSLEQRVMHETTHDNLTNLPNRLLLHDRIEQAINTASRHKYTIGLAIIDLDRFKEINDTLGHFAGDRLLKQVAMRLLGVVRKDETLARMGGDEFAILMTQVNDTNSPLSFYQRIRRAMDTPFTVENITLDVQASMGVSLYPQHGNDVDTLIQRAEVAMYAAKQQKNNGYAIYTSKLDRYSPKRLTLISELKQAIQNDELVLYYQPKVDLKNKKISKAEALVRWKHPTHGLLQPDEFINLAERTGLIIELSHWVLKTSIQQILHWQQKGLSINVAVNLSPSSLLSPELPEIITGILSSHNLRGSMLTVELTETSIIKDPELAYEILNRLKALGVDISIDDFGTGYSSLAQLRKLPVSEMKIDRSFVMDMLENKDDEIIVKSIIDLAHNLGLSVVAEGVETLGCARKLEQMDCDLLQGYYFSRPIPADKFEEWHASFSFT